MHGWLHTSQSIFIFFFHAVNYVMEILFLRNSPKKFKFASMKIGRVYEYVWIIKFTVIIMSIEWNKLWKLSRVIWIWLCINHCSSNYISYLCPKQVCQRVNFHQLIECMWQNFGWMVISKIQFCCWKVEPTSVRPRDSKFHLKTTGIRSKLSI